LLEAVAAMMIIGVVSAGALGAFAADLRAADRAQRALPAAALARERLTILETIGSTLLRALPDSLAHGRFETPFDAYAWSASASEARSAPALIELRVEVSWDDGSFALAERRYEPALEAGR
jgi:type II secretory pathway pseudopilin PulG